MVSTSSAFQLATMTRARTNGRLRRRRRRPDYAGYKWTTAVLPCTTVTRPHRRTSVATSGARPRRCGCLQRCWRYRVGIGARAQCLPKRLPQIRRRHRSCGVDVRRWSDITWGMEFMPDGRLLVTERTGRLRIISADGREHVDAGARTARGGPPEPWWPAGPRHRPELREQPLALLQLHRGRAWQAGRALNGVAVGGPD